MQGVSSAMVDSLRSLRGPKVGTLDICLDAWVLKELGGMERRLQPSRFFLTKAKVSHVPSGVAAK